MLYFLEMYSIQTLRRIALEDHISFSSLYKILKHTPATCYFCGIDSAIQEHHIIPRAKKGLNLKANLVFLCTECHTFLHEGNIERLLSKNQEYMKTLTQHLSKLANMNLSIQRLKHKSDIFTMREKDYDQELEKISLEDRSKVTRELYEVTCPKCKRSWHWYKSTWGQEAFEIYFCGRCNVELKKPKKKDESIRTENSIINNTENTVTIN